VTQPDQSQPIYPPQEWVTPPSQNEPETPDDRISIDLYPTIGQGSLTIDDGGGYYNYNQDLTEDDGRGEWQFPLFSGGDDSVTLLGILRDILSRLPFPALQVLESWLAGGIAVFESVTDAIEKIMSALRPGTIALRWNQFLELLVGWVEATPGDLDNWLLSLVGIDSVSTGSFSKESPELLKNPFFLTPVSLANGSTPGWHLDDEDKHSEKGNSAAIETDAVQVYTIISSVVRVEAEKILELRAYLKWEGVTSASGADAITLCLLPDGADPETGAIILDTITLDAALDDETTDWVEIEGRYTMPDEETFPAARLMVRLESLNVGATVKVSDVSFKKALAAQWWPMEWIDGLADAFNAVDEFFQNIIGAILGGFVDGDSSYWTLTDLLDEIGSWFLGTEDTAGVASDNSFGILEILQNIVNAFFGIENGEPNDEAAKAGMDAIYDAIQGVTTRVNELAGGQGPGAFYSVPFTTYYGDSFTLAGVPMDEYYYGAGDGFLYCRNETRWAENSPNANREVFCVYNNGGNSVLDTDDQLVTMTMDGIPEISGFTDPVSGGNSVVARSDGDAQNCVWAQVWRVPGLFWSSWDAAIGCVVDGVVTVWVDEVDFAWGNNIGLETSVSGDPYRFRLWVGETAVIDYDDSAHQSKLGEGFRHWGFHVNTGGDGHAQPAPIVYAAGADI
jgi:hypothetical protein